MLNAIRNLLTFCDMMRTTLTLVCCVIFFTLRKYYLRARYSILVLSIFQGPYLYKHGILAILSVVGLEPKISTARIPSYVPVGNNIVCKPGISMII